MKRSQTMPHRMSFNFSGSYRFGCIGEVLTITPEIGQEVSQRSLEGCKLSEIFIWRMLSIPSYALCASEEREGGSAHPTQVIWNWLSRLNALATQRAMQSVFLVFDLTRFFEKGDPGTGGRINSSGTGNGPRSRRRLQWMRVRRGG